MKSILKLRNTNDSCKAEDLESKFDFKLPPIYKLFAETFYLGVDAMIREVYYEKKSNDYFDCKSYVYFFNGENVGFSHFVELDKAFNVYSSGNLSDSIYQRKIFPFGSSDGNGLYVGTQGIDCDKIFWDRADGDSLVAVANNSFEFLRGIIVNDVEEEFLYGGIKLSQLYKNYEENFWRVKE
jgi:hypothetical protein